MSSQPKSPLSKRRILVAGAEGYTGLSILDLLVNHENFAGKYATVAALTFGEGPYPGLEELGVESVPFGTSGSAANALSDFDTVLIIPPASKRKFELTKGVLEQAKKAKSLVNMVLLSAAGCDYAEPHRQPRLREFIELEALAMKPKQDSSTEDTGHSTTILRAGFYAENLLLYSKQAQQEGKLPLPIDPNHKFPPVALGDVALFIANCLMSEGPHGFGDTIRGHLFVLTGPQLVAGPELAVAASQALSMRMDFESVSEAKARKILTGPQGEELDDAEREYLLEYYSLVREGKASYVADQGFAEITGQPPTMPTQFFELYSSEFKPAKRRKTKR